jgi:hypothetical protein
MMIKTEREKTILKTPFMVLFKKLDQKERKDFNTYLEQFTHEVNAQKLYQYCLSHKRNPPNDYWKRGQISDKVFDAVVDHNKQLNNALSALHERLQHYLILQIAFEEGNKGLLLLEVYRRKNLNPNFIKQLSFLQSIVPRGVWDFWRKIPLGHKAYYDDTENRADKSITLLADTLQQLEELKYLLTLKYACEAKSRLILGFQDEAGLFHHFNPNVAVHFSNPLIALYQASYQLLCTPTKENFEDLLKQFLDHASSINPEEAQSLFAYLYNHCAQGYKAGKVELLGQAKSLIEFAHEHYILSFGALTDNLLINNLGIYCSQECYEEAGAYLSQFQQAQPARAEIIHLANALIKQYQNQIDRTGLENLKHQGYQSPSNKYLARLLFLCYTFRLEADIATLYDFLEREQDNIRKWQAIPDLLKAALLDMVYILKSFLDPNIGDQALKAEILNRSGLSFKNWLLALISQQRANYLP